MKKFKRFDSGGSVAERAGTEYSIDPEEAALKAQGRKLSKGQTSGMGGLGRLLQGNIDNPESEAYAKYGAGKPKAEAVLNTTRRGGREEDDTAPTATPIYKPR